VLLACAFSGAIAFSSFPPSCRSPARPSSCAISSIYQLSQAHRRPHHRRRIAATLGRALRNATRGFVVTPVKSSGYEKRCRFGGIISVARHGSAPASHPHTGPDLADSSGPTENPSAVVVPARGY